MSDNHYFPQVSRILAIYRYKRRLVVNARIHILLALLIVLPSEVVSYFAVQGHSPVLIPTISIIVGAATALFIVISHCLDLQKLHRESEGRQ